MVRLASKKQFFVVFGRGDLRISQSGTKFDAEADFDVCSAVAPPKPHKIDEKLISKLKKDFDFGMPDPHPMDFTRCLHKLTGSVLHKRGPEVLSEYLT